MRYIAKTKINTDNAVRLMINQSDEGVYVFGYDTMIDTYSNFDYLFANIDKAKEFGIIEFGINDCDWIVIDSESKGCQQDWIDNVIQKRKNNMSYFYSKDSGQLIDSSFRDFNINGMTVNERLFTVGLLQEFDKSVKMDKLKARQILEYINIDNESIEKII